VLHLARIGLGYCTTELATRYHLSQEDVGQAFQAHYSQIKLEKQVLMPGALDVCKFIAWNGGVNVIVTHRGRKSTLALLRAHVVRDLFQDLITADDGFPKKPDPAGMETIIKRNGLVKDFSLVVGDRELDIEAGIAAGVRTCVLGENKQNIVADYHVSNLLELYEIVLTENVE
jgi:phosphoglycolate phosphatase-like HAD superfamily hydrolase